MALAEESALQDELLPARLICTGRDDQLATGIDGGLAPGHQEIARFRPPRQRDAFELEALMAVRNGGRVQVGFGEAVEDATAAPGQRLEQLQVIRADSGAVAVEANRTRVAALEPRDQRGHFRLTPGDLAVGKQEYFE